jgi:hypothetical protein
LVPTQRRASPLNWYQRRASRGKTVQLVPTESFEARPLNWYRRRASRGKAIELVPTEGFERQGGSVNTDGGFREARRFSWYRRRASRGKAVQLVPTEGFERQGFVFVEPVHQLVPTRGFDEMVPTKEYPAESTVGTNGNTCERLVLTKQYCTG